MAGKPMLIENDIRVRGYDIDVMGIVSNIVYIRWFEDLRHAFLDKYCPYEGMIVSKKSPILVKTEIEYKTPLTIYDNPLGRCWMSNIGRSKWEMEFEIISEDTVHCIGKQSGCFYDIEKKKPVSLPSELTRQYNEELAKMEV